MHFPKQMKQMSNYYLPCFNRMDFAVIPSDIKLP